MLSIDKNKAKLINVVSFDDDDDNNDEDDDDNDDETTLIITTTARFNNGRNGYHRLFCGVLSRYPRVQRRDTDAYAVHLT